MTKTKLWKALSGRLSRAQRQQSDQTSCCAAGEHRGSLIAVASSGSATTMMCTRHAMGWTDSDLCHDIAANNSGASLAAMSLWVSSTNALAAAAAQPATQASPWPPAGTMRERFRHAAA